MLPAIFCTRPRASRWSRSAQVWGAGGGIPPCARALLQIAQAAEPLSCLQLALSIADQAPLLEHGAKERTRLVATDFKPVLEGGEGGGGHRDRPRLAALAPADPRWR
jgi:hypothetical protein